VVERHGNSERTE